MLSFDFEIIESKEIKGVFLIKPSSFADNRGEIWTSFSKEISNLLPEEGNFAHDKFVYSKKNTLRGIHYDTKTWKLVSCLHGQVEQVVVDKREGSLSFNKWQKFDLNYKNKNLILIPPKVGNAFFVKSDYSLYHYKLSYFGDYLDANQQKTIKWDDKELNINWSSLDPILSERDS